MNVGPSYVEAAELIAGWQVRGGPRVVIAAWNESGEEVFRVPLGASEARRLSDQLAAAATEVEAAAVLLAVEASWPAGDISR
jgi:hypothetical protein